MLKVFILYFLTSSIFSNELILEDRNYKEEDGNWYNYSSGYKGDRMIMNRMIVRKTDRSLPLLSDFTQLGLKKVKISNSLIPGNYCLIEIEMEEDPIPIANITYELPVESEVNISVYDLSGRKLTELVSEKQIAGSYNTSWDAEQYASGVYIIKMETSEFNTSQKVVLLK